MAQLIVLNVVYVTMYVRRVEDWCNLSNGQSLR